MGLGERVRKAWNAFTTNRDPTGYYATGVFETSSTMRPDRAVRSRRNERSIVGPVYTRISIDAAAIPIRHVQLDKNGQYKEERTSSLNDCLKYSANIDQTGTDFIQDVVESMLDEGVIAIVPTDTDKNPYLNPSFDILSMRVGKVVEWFPKKVRIEVYNEEKGEKQTVTMLKEHVAIVYNPFYSIMNEPNSVGQRLIRKLSILDAIDEQSGSGKLDMIIQLPFSIRGEKREEQAKKRKQAIEDQLNGSKYGIAYIDSTEHITQLNRPVDNNLMKQIEFLRDMLYSQLGITQEILNGTAKEEEMNNYYQRIIAPILSAITEEMERKYLTKTAITQGQAIRYFRDPFKLVPVGSLADLADKLIRNTILTPNDMRQKIGMKPATDEGADELRNPNIAQSKEEIQAKLGTPIEKTEVKTEEKEEKKDEVELKHSVIRRPPKEVRQLPKKMKWVIKSKNVNFGNTRRD